MVLTWTVAHTALCVCLQLWRPQEAHCESRPVAGLQAGSQGPPFCLRALRSLCVCSVCPSASFRMVAESGPAWSFLYTLDPPS